MGGWVENRFAIPAPRPLRPLSGFTMDRLVVAGWAEEARTEDLARK